MATKNNIIKILFGVEGGGSINGESGLRIKQQLEAIARQIKLNININEKHFSQQLSKLHKNIQAQLGDLKINIGSGGTKAGSAGTANQSEAERQQIANYKELKAQLKEIHAEETKLLSLRKRGEAQALQQAKVDKVSQDYFDKVTDAEAKGLISEKHIELLNQYEEKLNSVLNIKQAVAADQDVGQKISFSGARANAESLIERYQDLIKHNKDAARTAEELAKAAREPLHENPAKAAEQVRKLGQMSKEANAQFARLSVQTDTFGNKIRKAFNNKVINGLAFALSALLAKALRDVYQNVVQLDKAVTDLQIATGKSREEAKQLVVEYARMGRQLGATATQVAESADTFLRQGYTLAEVNKLIKSALMLSKLGQVGSDEAAKALTSSIKGYKVAIDDVESIVDKFTAVDMSAAVSAGYIATAMSETAVSANLAGISMDRLIGMISTVGETTQAEAGRVGAFFRTFFARLGNVKAGKFVDDETGESLNDMEKVLGAVGISLRDVDGEFRNFGTVLDEISAKWDNYTNIQQRAIATAAAGKFVPERTEMCA